MRVFSSWRFAGSVSLLSTAVLLWLGTFLLSWPASGSELSAVLTIVGVPHAEQVANGHQIGGQYPAMLPKRMRVATSFRKTPCFLGRWSLCTSLGQPWGGCWPLAGEAAGPRLPR